MPIVDYPAGLGTVLMTKNRSQAATFSMYEPKSGPGYTKNTSIDVPVFWDATFKFKASDAQRFHGWFMGALNRGRNPFNMLLSTEFGNVSHVCQFMPDSLLPQSREANVHTYTAQIRSEAIKYPPYIEENFGFVASEFWPLRAEWDYALNSLTPVSNVPSNPVGTTANFTDGLYYDNATTVAFSDLVTFSRLSAGSYIDTDGVLKTAAIGEPRFEAGGLLVEPQSTNLIFNAETVTFPAIAGATTVEYDTDSIPGFRLVRQVCISSVISGSSPDVATGIELAVGDTITTSAIFKMSESESPGRFRFRFAAGSFLFDHSFYTDMRSESVSGTVITKTQPFSDKSLVYVETKRLITAPASWVGVRLQALNVVGTTVVGAFQLEKSPSRTSYIKTTGVAVTRASDSAAVDMQPHTAGTIFAEFLSDAVAIERVVYTAGSVTLKRLSTGAISVTTGAVAVTSSVVPSGSVKVAISYDGNTLKLAVNGIVYSAASALPYAGVSIALGNTTFANVWQRSEAYDNAQLIEVTQ